MAWLSFTELDKAVVVVWLDWLVFCDYGLCVCPLMPLVTPTVLLGFLLPWAWGISSRLLQQSAAIAPYLGWGVSPLCDPMDCSLPGSSIHGIFQARIILEWVDISFSRRSFWHRVRTRVSLIIGRCFTIWATREVLVHACTWSKVQWLLPFLTGEAWGQVILSLSSLLTSAGLPSKQNWIQSVTKSFYAA